MDNLKKLSNPASTGSKGTDFEAKIQAKFVLFMLLESFCPCLPAGWPIYKISFQGKHIGYNTDDLIVYVKNENGNEERKLLGQVKLTVTINKANRQLSETIKTAWHDFNNEQIFTKHKDVIALITGPLSRTDLDSAIFVLNHAKNVGNSIDFFNDVKLANFSPSKAEEKLDVFKHHLKSANDGNTPDNEEIYLFLKHFHILSYDISYNYSSIIPLIHALISSRKIKESAEAIWSKIQVITRPCNFHAGTIEKDNLPDNLRELFREVAYPQKNLTIKEQSTTIISSNNTNNATLALILLIGSWRDDNTNDISLISNYLDLKQSELRIKLKEITGTNNSPLSIKNKLWLLIEKNILVQNISSYILDHDIDNFKKIAISVLNEINPAFKLPIKNRFMASFYGESYKYSEQLRKGISEGIAILGNNSELFINCSDNKISSSISFILRNIFKNKSWQVWGSLGELLPNIAEASPNEFLSQLEESLNNKSNAFQLMFAEANDGLTWGGNLHVGLLWALEATAWKQDYFTRSCSLLAKLAEIDPGGRLSNRPFNSLTTILLPWSPQTTASIEARKAVVTKILKTSPTIGWKLLTKLLPNKILSTSGTYQPKWALSAQKLDIKVKETEYWEQTESYAKLLVEQTKANPQNALELIQDFDNLPKNSFNNFMEILTNDIPKISSSDERKLIWERLTKFIIRHKKHSNTKWVLPNEYLDKIEQISELYIPNDELSLNQILFSNQDMELYEGNHNWDEENKKLSEKRKTALKKLLEKGGVDLIITFIESIQSPEKAGNAFAHIASDIIDEKILPKLLGHKNQKILEFINAYIWTKQHIYGWKWIDSLVHDSWSDDQIGQILLCLPFNKETWNRASEWLNCDEKKYWEKVVIRPHQTNENLEDAIEKLLQYERPIAAINCLAKIKYDNKKINNQQCIKALLNAISSKENLNKSLDQYYIIELIKYLQSSNHINENDLFNIEWAYLSLIKNNEEVAPITLESKIANNAEFFCELIKYLYRSENERESHQKKPSKVEQSIANNAWKLLETWKKVPGMKEDGKFNPSDFNKWVTDVRKISKESGHLKIALQKIGEVLIYSPPDDDLWIHRSIATVLDADDASDLRTGYLIETMNTRGVYTNSGGEEERKLSEKFGKKADLVENSGFFTFATILREISQDYLHQANSRSKP